MAFDLNAVLGGYQRDSFDLHTQFLNPQLVKVLRTIGFDRHYVRGEGSYLVDDKGDSYLDFLSGFGVYALGRSHPVIKDALHQALDADLPNMVQLDCALLPGLLAEALVARTHPGIERVTFTNSGAEATEAAIKFARCATGRGRILYCDHAFHGLTNGALSLNGGREFRDGFEPLLPKVDQIPFGDLDALARELGRGDVAAFVVEPIQGKGVYMAPDGFWPEAQALCRTHGALLVIDEVQTGLGRTGRFLCHEHWDLQPDIITVSKALSGGYIPVGAVLTSAKVFDAVYNTMDRAVVHSSTFSRNQLAMVAGLATLGVIDDEDIVARSRRNGERFMEALAPLVAKYEVLQEVRGMGLMIGLEFAAPSGRGPRTRYRLMELARKGMFSQLIVVPLFHRHHILTQVAADNVNIIKLLPPLIIGEPEIKLFVSALDDVLGDAERSSGLLLEVGKSMTINTLRRHKVPAPR
ncbi:MAG TPA: aspartate aminotransferase family protein [Acidimicrobiales bacterium]|jgi:acetylornithine/succinyldiaminopimelate/putrescine aminotransferase|nr:aspartate aminotransferase family protein [Acidimicrobiales bacterium]